MQWSDISFAPPSRTLRQFAGMWTLFFGGLACWQGLVRDNTTVAWILAGLALAVGPLGLIKPQAIRLVFVGAMLLAFPIGWLVSRVILALIFYGLITPVGLVLRLTRRDPLCRGYRPDLESYWQPKPMPTDVRSYFRQF